MSAAFFLPDWPPLRTQLSRAAANAVHSRWALAWELGSLPASLPAEKKGFFGLFLEALAEALTEDDAAEPVPEDVPEMTEEEEEEMAAWIRENFGDVFYSGSGSAGQDGHTVRMMGRPGRVLPCLVYIVMEPNSMEMRQMNFLVYLNRHWVELTKLLEGIRTGGKPDWKAGLFENGLFLDCLEILFRGNWMNALTLDVRGGETFRIPDTGLDALDLSGNMALPMIPEAIEVISRKSRPKPVSEQE